MSVLIKRQVKAGNNLSFTRDRIQTFVLFCALSFAHPSVNTQLTTDIFTIVQSVCRICLILDM